LNLEQFRLYQLSHFLLAHCSLFRLCAITFWRISGLMSITWSHTQIMVVYHHSVHRHR